MPGYKNKKAAPRQETRLSDDSENVADAALECKTLVLVEHPTPGAPVSLAGRQIIETPLSLNERNQREALEAIIQSGLKTFVEVGNALLKIRDARLYRQDFDTFEDYCQIRWKMSRVHAHRMIEAASVVSNLLPIGNIPTHESQVRPLTKLQPDQQRDVWAVASAINPNPTAVQVEQVAKTMGVTISQAHVQSSNTTTETDFSDSTDQAPTEKIDPEFDTFIRLIRNLKRRPENYDAVFFATQETPMRAKQDVEACKLFINFVREFIRETKALHPAPFRTPIRESTTAS